MRISDCGLTRAVPLLIPRSGIRIPRFDERQPDAEGRAVADAAARRRDGAAVKLDEVARDGEAEAEAAVLARDALVGLAEAVEDVRQEFGRDAAPRVGDR